MSEQEKNTAKHLVDIINRLSPEDKRYLQGYAEGLADRVTTQQQPPQPAGE